MASEKQSIVVVDDEVNIVSALKEILSEKYNVFSAPDGKQAMELITKIKPRLVLLDVMMPGMDGLEVARRLKADAWTRGIPIVFLTAKTQTQDVESGFKSGAAAYILKPFSPEKLMKKVDEVIMKDEINRSV